MRPKGRKGHRRQYIPGSQSITHYDRLLWLTHARKLQQFQAAQVVKLIHAAKTSMSGTTSHVRVQEQFAAYSAQFGFFRRLAMRIEVKGARLWSWLTRRDVENYRSFKEATV